MSTIQTTISALVLGLLVGLGLGATGAWQWQKNQYELKITKLEEKHNGYVREQQEAIAQKAEQALESERASAARVSEAQSKLVAANKRLGDVQAELDRLRRDYGGLYVKSSACVSSASSPAGPSSGASAASTNSPTGLCKLSREFEDSLIQTYRDADSMRNTLELCRNYAQEIERFRTEHGSK